MQKTETAKLQIVIQVKTTIGDGTKEQPFRSVYRFFYPNGTLIGEVDANYLDRNIIAEEVQHDRKRNSLYR